MNYNIFKAPLLSFFSKQFYRETALKGKGMGFLYLFVIVFVANLLSVASGYFHLLGTIDGKDVTEVISKIPDITIKEGKMSFNKPSPYDMVLADPAQTPGAPPSKIRIRFDNDGKTEGLPDDVKVILTPDVIIFEGQDNPIKWSDVTTNFDLPQSAIKPHLKTIAAYIFGFGVLLFGPLAWLFHMIVALIYGAVGLIMDRNKLGYKTAVRMATVAMTPTIMLTMIFYLLYAYPDLWPVITVPISLGYLFFGFSSVGDPSA